MCDNCDPACFEILFCCCDPNGGDFSCCDSTCCESCLDGCQNSWMFSWCFCTGSSLLPVQMPLQDAGVTTQEPSATSRMEVPSS
ncbi:hypothetical protein B0H17DRAFT_1339152 [Mycena rosella]|uniref:Uncharacterized protein n=1 Tax=Mycena rosella TaxID=1033263 RepID=A0AAD7C9Q7_MYCRO|nr:hypothetical protein B0H17DRAFT_1339152 [Mycena rosella]